MARRRISVEKINEVIRYELTTERSQRAIGRVLKVSRTAADEVPGVLPRQRTDLGAGAGAARQRAAGRIGGQSPTADERAL